MYADSTQTRYFFAFAQCRLTDDTVVSKAVYATHTDSYSDQDTLVSIKSIVSDIIFDKGSDAFDVPVECINVEGGRVITKDEYDRAPYYQRF